MRVAEKSPKKRAGVESIQFWRARTYPCSEDLAREGGEVAGAGADVEEAEALTQVERLDRRPINPWSGEMLHAIPEGHINVADLLIAAVIGRVDEEAAVDRAEGLDHALGADRAVV